MQRSPSDRAAWSTDSREIRRYREHFQFSVEMAMSDQSATAMRCQRLRVPPTLPSPVVRLAARAGRRCFLLEDDRAGVRKRGAEFLARADPELAEDLVQMSIAPDWEQRVGVAGAFDPARDRPGSPDGGAGRRATTLAQTLIGSGTASDGSDGEESQFVPKRSVLGE
jgi:hypothetical protein